MQLMKNLNTVRTELIMKRDMRTIQHIVIPMILHRLLTDTTTLCTFKKIQEMVTTKNRHQNDDWFAKGRSPYKQTLACKFKMLLILVSHMTKNSKADCMYAKGLLCMVTEA